MSDLQTVAKSAAVLKKRLEMPLPAAEKVAATFDEYDHVKIVEVDETAEARPMDEKAEANAEAKQKIEELIEAAQQRTAAA